jgi:hypothetical protein
MNISLDDGTVPYNWGGGWTITTTSNTLGVQCSNEEKSVRRLWQVYLVDISTGDVYCYPVVAENEAKAHIKAFNLLTADVDLDNLDIFAEEIGEVREPEKKG